MGRPKVTNTYLITSSPDGSANFKKMTFIKPFALDEFDLMWKDFFNSTPHFSGISSKVSHPTDIYETETGITIEVAAVGLDKEEIEILTEGDILRIRYKRKEDAEKPAIYKGIKRSSFDLAWRIASKFELSDLEAKLEKGLLSLNIPFAESKKPKLITIK
jgi:HSP20 family protein